MVKEFVCGAFSCLLVGHAQPVLSRTINIGDRLFLVHIVDESSLVIRYHKTA